MILLAACAFVIRAPENVFVSGEEGFDTYRIPALAIASNGDWLAFAEGRRNVGDQAGNRIVLKRRGKGAVLWNELQIVADDGDCSLNNPCVVTLPRGRVLLMYQRYPKGIREATAPPGLDGPKILRSYVVESRDNGDHWRAPVDITSVAKRSASVRTLASGPGIGVQLRTGKHKGRLVFPFNERADDGWDAFALYSDDGGNTWKAGKAAPQPAGEQANEVQMAEIGPDKILLNARNQGKTHARLQAVSDDGGETWGEVSPVPALPDPACMGSLIADHKGRLYFSNPADIKERTKGKIHVSDDRGSTWKELFSFSHPFFGYSSLALTSDRRLGCLFETMERSSSGRERYIIQFTESPLGGR